MDQHLRSPGGLSLTNTHMNIGETKRVWMWDLRKCLVGEEVRNEGLAILCRGQKLLAKLGCYPQLWIHRVSAKTNRVLKKWVALHIQPWFILVQDEGHL